MKIPCSLSAGRLALILCSLFLLSACVPALTPVEPSAALKQQFAQLQQQQRQQAEQIKTLQLQLSQLRQKPLTSVATIDEPQSPTVEPPPVSTASPFPATPAEPMTIPAPIRQEVAALANSASTYLAAFSDLAAGHFAAAETGFSRFLSKYPKHQYAQNARYWLASAQLSQDKRQAAAANLQQVIAADNGQERAPAALVLLARIYRQQQLNNAADEALEQLRSRYPESTEAQQLYRSDKPQQ